MISRYRRFGLNEDSLTDYWRECPDAPRRIKVAIKGHCRTVFCRIGNGVSIGRCDDSLNTLLLNDGKGIIACAREYLETRIGEILNERLLPCLLRIAKVVANRAPPTSALPIRIRNNKSRTLFGSVLQLRASHRCCITDKLVSINDSTRSGIDDSFAIACNYHGALHTLRAHNG